MKMPAESQPEYHYRSLHQYEFELQQQSQVHVVVIRSSALFSRRTHVV